MISLMPAARDLKIRPWAGILGLCMALITPQIVQALDDGVTSSHGYSYFGNLDYPADYAHLNYVNPDAPKGGELSLAASGTFDSLNPYSRKGRAGALTTLQYDRLFESADDGVGQYYGVLAESLEYDEGRNYVIFHLRPEATFWDGTSVTAEDVVYSHRLFIEQGLPSYAQAVGRMVTGAEALDEHTVKFSFNPEVTRRSLIETVGSTPVFSKAWFEADESRRLDEPRLEVAVGSGPYKLDSYDINRRIVYKRRDDYWGKDLPFNVGRNNFDTIRVEYFADQTAAFEGFKAGEYTLRIESDPKLWATGYDFPKLSEGVVVRDEIVDGSPPTPSGFVFNLGKPQFADKDVRKALALAFNFEWANESLLFGLNAPRNSFIQGTPLEAKGLPEGDELAFLQALGDVVPGDFLTEPAVLAHESNPARLNDRRNLRKAAKILDEAGWPVGDGNVRRNAEGQTLKVNIPYPSNLPTSTATMIETYVQNLQSIGVDASAEKVDPAQYTLRSRERDYDMVYSTRYGSFLSTGGGLSQMYGSEEAAFSLFNPAGLASPLVDAIIEASFETDNQADQDTALTALDRALRYEFFVVPVGFIADYWTAYYDMYEYPENLPPYSLGHLDLWWINPEKEAALKAKGALR
ncbi:MULTISPECIES: extracellular solute-binding protein [unclassified Ruegeria]|uniref:extracellular solute-binding protein n=1 Tax=unclassified Ruegeria TaxID=2625375 RepID=UPI001492A243|nr:MULTISPECIES: extracellular solute-binding protein [unclassified Ruegeria]NOD49118.1 ABC transporter substrate-binding protein [Ruegeria sp. HKCCD5849]NOD51682.1 ABC transporter substrate-binding protein [Ruegeria sp. HKCCD5851]NOD68668.1 ABC transporter substrate-binding protein [Ruegeria sp. HKCCD7303]